MPDYLKEAFDLIHNMCTCEGRRTDCAHEIVHEYVESVRISLQEAMRIEEERMRLGEIADKLAAKVKRYAGHLDKIQRIANERPLEEYQGRYDPLSAATAVLNEIRTEVNSRDQRATLSRMRAEALRDAADRLHVDLGAGVCLCGEPYDDERKCSEYRRMTVLADRMEDEEDEDGELE